MVSPSVNATHREKENTAIRIVCSLHKGTYCECIAALALSAARSTVYRGYDLLARGQVQG